MVCELSKLSRLCSAKFRVKIKSLAAEARIIRQEERRCSHGDYAGESQRGCLRHHRTTVVRLEQRSTLLAYAFLRGRKYRQVERARSPQADYKAIVRIIKSLTFSVVSEDDIDRWIHPD